MNQRMCASCRTKSEKSNFIRLERHGNIAAIAKKKSDGSRGIYFCKDINCILKAQKSNIIGRTFKVDVDPNIYNQMKEIIERKLNGK